MSFNKKAGIEMSMTTIVIIVISVIILIFGIVFAKNIMCSGIRATDQIDSAVKNELRDIFGADKIGVSCQGEEGSELKLGTGKRVSVVCQIKTEENIKYKIDVGDPEILLGNEKTQNMQKSWILKSGWTGYVTPGTIMYAPILYLNILSDAPKSSVSVDLKVTNTDTGNIETHTIVFDIEPMNFIQTTLC